MDHNRLLATVRQRPKASNRRKIVHRICMFVPPWTRMTSLARAALSRPHGTILLFTGTPLGFQLSGGRGTSFAHWVLNGASGKNKHRLAVSTCWMQTRRAVIFGMQHMREARRACAKSGLLVFCRGNSLKTGKRKAFGVIPLNEGSVGIIRFRTKVRTAWS